MPPVPAEPPVPFAPPAPLELAAEELEALVVEVAVSLDEHAGMSCAPRMGRARHTESGRRRTEERPMAHGKPERLAASPPPL
jgi:hypothetical protein